MTILSNAQNTKSFYDFKTTTIDEQPFDLPILKGKKVLVVNTAIQVWTHILNMQQLEELYQKYERQKNSQLSGFPANNFLSQEPGTNAEIKEFCTRITG